MAFAKAVAVHVASDGWQERAFAEIVDRRKEDILELLGSLWRDLAPAVRQALIDGDPSTISDATRAMLRSHGYFSRSDGLIRPAWLCEVGQTLGIAPLVTGSDDQPISRVERLHALMHSINAILRRGGYQRGFETSTELLKHYLLTRMTVNEQNVVECVNHLSKVLYEGARRRAGGGKEWRLPPSLVTTFKKHIGYQQLVALRNFWDHDPEWDMKADRPNSNFVNEGDVYIRQCGTRNPTSAVQWQQVRDGLVQDLIRALEELEAGAQSLPAAMSQ
jgi:hypothetical protein